MKRERAVWDMETRRSLKTEIWPKKNICIQLHCVKVRENKSVIYTALRHHSITLAELGFFLVASSSYSLTITCTIKFILFACKNAAFYTKQDISRVLRFRRVFFRFPFWIRLTANKIASISRNKLEIGDIRELVKRRVGVNFFF